MLSKPLTGLIPCDYLIPLIIVQEYGFLLIDTTRAYQFPSSSGPLMN